MGKTKVIASGVVWTVISNVVAILYGIASVPFLLNYFGKEEYGLIGLALSVNVYIQLLDMGMNNSNVRFFSEFIAKNDEDSTQKLFNLTHLFYLIIGALNSIILFGVSFFVSDLFNVSPEQALTLRNLLWVLALNATFSWISVCFDQLLRAHELIDWIKKRLTVLKLLQFVVLVTTITLNLSIEVYFFAYIFMGTIILPLTMIKVRKIAPRLKFGMGFETVMLKKVLPYSLSVFSFDIFYFLTIDFRPLILGNMSGPGSVAELNIMATIASVITIISGSFLQVLLPIVTKLKVNDDKKGINLIVNTGTKYVNILLSFMVFMIFLSVEEILTVYVGEEYSTLALWMRIWLLTILLAHRNVMTALVFTEKRLIQVSIMSAIAMTIAIVCYLVFIPKYGVGGAVIGFAAHELVHFSFYYVYFLPKRFEINTASIFIKSILPCWISCLIVCFILCICFRLIELSAWGGLILKSVAFTALIIPVIWFILLNKQDKQFIMDFINRK